ncbi:MAG TPA: TIGR03619 family F420-dependent LLM class oxidoreductase [Solirubrobacteraceae bacterium]|jgi:probable F420-dependent oxidoreductase
MRIGLSAYDWRARELLELGMLAEEFGFDALWLGEHVVVPAAYASVHPTESEGDNTVDTSLGAELLDPWSALSAIAAVTKRLRLATGICIVPLRHPLLVARASVTVHELSGGRFMLGAGAGWLKEEFAALDVPFEERGSRLDEALAILRMAWAGGALCHAGCHYSFEPVRVTTRSAQIPLVLGGNSERALKRAAMFGDAWYASGVPTLAKAEELRRRLTELRAEHREDEPIACYVRLQGDDPGVLAGYAAAGFEDVVLVANDLFLRRSPQELRADVRRLASNLGLC